MTRPHRRSWLQRRLYRWWYRRFYLRSRHWRQYRRVRLAAAHNRCERCGAGPFATLDVHHLTYARVGHEHIGDTKVLCRHCHQLVDARGRAVPRIA
jgi:hypothetical protein